MAGGTNPRISTDSIGSTPSIEDLVLEDQDAPSFNEWDATPPAPSSRFRVHFRAAAVYEASKPWILLVWTGVSVGVLAAGIDTVSQWLGSIKLGYCKTSWYLNQDFCCWDGESSWAASCDQWVTYMPSVYVVRYLLYIIFGVVFSVVASLLVSRFAPNARLSGIPEVKIMVDGAVIPDYLTAPVLLVKTLGLSLIVGAGLWAGKEGPLVHVACCCASIMMSTLYKDDDAYKSSWRKKLARLQDVLPAASAAGISVAFGAPIGGVLFALEAISSYYNNDTRVLWHSFVCAMVAAVSLQWMNPFRTGKLVLFQVVYDRVWHRFELIPFAAIGVLGGLYGAAAIKLNAKFSTLRKTSPILSSIPPYVEVAAAAFVTAFIAYPVSFMRMQSSVLLTYLFQECTSDVPGHLCDTSYWFSNTALLMLSAGVGVVLTAYTFGMNIPAGTLMPSMAVGALGGRAIGVLMQTWQENHEGFFLFSSCPPPGSGTVCITPGVYAVVGAASALTGLTRLTVSAVVILFELTGALTYVLPIMTGVMVSKWVAQAFEPTGIYEYWIFNHIKYPLLDKSRDVPIRDAPASNYMTPADDIPCIALDDGETNTVRALLDLVGNNSSAVGFPVVDNVGSYKICGYITREDLQGALKEALRLNEESSPCYFRELPEVAQSGPLSGVDLRSYVDIHPTRLSMRSDVILAIKMFEELGLACLLLTHRGRLTGVLTKSDIWNMLNSKEGELMSEARLSPRDAEARADAEADDQQDPLLGGSTL